MPISQRIYRVNLKLFISYKILAEIRYELL